MTSAVIVQYVEQRPFVPFTMVLANSREVHVAHAEFVITGNAVQCVYVILPTARPEIIDTAPIVSIRTFYPAELPTL